MFTNLGAELWGWVNLSFLDPIWAWGVRGAFVILISTAIAYFFGDWIKPLRPLAGGIIIGIIGMLYAYRKGETERAEFEKRHKRK